MLTVEEAEIRVTELQREMGTLQAALVDLTQQHKEANDGLAGLFATSERTPTPQAARAADQASAAARLLGTQVERKQAAVTACEADLAAAQQDVQLAQRAAIVVQIEGLYAELVDIAAQLDSNPLQAALWRRVVEIKQKGDALYFQVRPTDQPWKITIFLGADIAVSRVVQRVEATLYGATDLRAARQHKIEFATVADAMDLAKLRGEIDGLRRLHIEPLEQSAAAALPVAVLV